MIKKFEEQAKKFPERVAVTCGNKKVSYHQLNQKANLLANYLIELGVTRNSLVGVILPRSIDFIVAILAIIKARGSYIPIDPTFPVERIQRIIDDARLSILITQTDIIKLPSKDEINLISIDTFEKTLPAPCQSNPLLLNEEEDQIYVIYTSGSTGLPKGAINTHKGFKNLVEWYIAEFKMNQDDKVLIYTALSFDLTQKNIFAPLVVGAQLFLLEDTPYNPELIVEKIQEYKITWINSTPSAFYPLVENESHLSKLSTLKNVFVGGEPFFAKRVLPIKNFNPKLNIVNTYGPTECADVCAYYPLHDKDFNSNDLCMPIGKAIQNMQMHVLNEQMEEVAIGEIGELYISGIGVGLGYLNNEELTKKAFISDLKDINNKKILYKTGDLVRYLPDFTIEFIERSDFQVKIRGYRVELEEILNVLKIYPGVKDALVVAHENEEREKYLVGYVVDTHKKDNNLDSNRLRKHLENFLPSYMIPVAILIIDSFPLTLNGKIDRKKLPLPPSASPTASNQTLSITEKKLVEIWSSLLPIQCIRVNDNFFLLGGHSLSAIKLIFKIRQEFGIQLTIPELFTHSTISSLGKLIGQKKKQHSNKMIGIKKSSSLQTEYPLSFPHQRIWYIVQTFKNPIIFNNLITLSLKGPLDIDKLEYAFHKLIERHEIFRTCIFLQNSQPYEKLFNSLDFKLDRRDFSDDDLDVRQTKVKEFALDVVSIPFDLTQLPLIKAHIVTLDHNHHVLIMCIHQFLIDGFSMDIFYSELTKFYNDKALAREPLSIQYRDYAIWQNNELIEKNLKDEIEFWRNELAGAPKQINLQLDKIRPEEFSYEGRVHTTFLSPNTTNKVINFCKAHDITLFMALLSAYAVLLFNHSQDEDILIGSPIANRTQPELENLIGFFVNLVPYRVKLQSHLTFRELVDEIKKIALAVYSHQDLPFIQLPDYLQIKREKSYHPVFQAVFAMQPYGVDSLKLDEVAVKDLDYEEPVAKFDLTLNASVKKEGIELKFEYAVDLFFQKTIEDMAEEYEKILQQAMLNPNITLSHIIEPFKLREAI